MKGLLKRKAQAGLCALTYRSFPLSESLCTNVQCSSVSPFPSLRFLFLFFLFKTNTENNNPQNRVLVYMFVHALETEKKNEIIPGHCVSEKCSERIDRGLLFGAALNQMWPHEESDAGNGPGGSPSVCEWYPSVSCQCQWEMYRAVTARQPAFVKSFAAATLHRLSLWKGGEDSETKVRPGWEWEKRCQVALR